MRMRFFVFLCAFVSAALIPSSVHASQATTYTFGENSKGRYVRTQDAYLPDRNVTGLGLTKPESIAFGPDDILYIADTGGKRIVAYDVKNDVITAEIKHGEFNTPRGVFVTGEGLIYVADSSAEKVFLFGSDLSFVKAFTRPDSIAFGETPFSPYRVAADPGGNVFIVSEGVYSGIIQLSGGGEFLGFFASNRTTMTFVQLLQDLFFTDRQKEALADRQPVTFSNVFVDGRGVVYSTSMGLDAYELGAGLKKHNMAGRNTLGEVWTPPTLTDVTVGGGGLIFTSNIGGFIQVNANDGTEIFFFGAGQQADDDIAGLYKSLMSVAVSGDGHIWTLDSEKAFLQSFIPTEYALSIYKALNLFDAGRYAEAGEEWAGVLRFNQMNILAHNGLGKSYLYRQQYAAAQNEFKVAGNRDLFSQAFWETRNRWLMDNLDYALLITAGIFIALTVIKYADRKKRVRAAAGKAVSAVMENRWLKHAAFSFSVARRPLDSYYYMRTKEKGSLAGAAVMFALFFAAYMTFQTGKAFILQYSAVEDMDFNVVIGGFFGICALFVICNYLVTSINDGEGGIAEIFKVVAFASFPLTAALFGVTALTYALTLNEVFLTTFALVFGGVWSAVLLYLGLQEMHGYDFRDTVKSLVITAAFMLIAVVVLFNLTILFEQFTQFAEAVVRELVANVFNLY